MLADMLESAYDQMVVEKPEFDYDRIAQLIDEIMANTGPIEITVVADAIQYEDTKPIVAIDPDHLT